MNKISKFFIASLLATIAVFAYLTLHHYQLKIGVGSGNSLCSISSKINCDAAATSAYAEVFGIPVALLGGIFHLIVLGFVCFYSLGWISGSVYLKQTLRTLVSASALVSVIMGVISFFIIKVICPFCTASYVLSFINLYLGWNLVTDSKGKFDVAEFFQDYKGYLYAIVSVPAFAWVVSGMIQKEYGLDEMKKYIPEKIAIWKNGKEFTFDPGIGISKHVENPRMTLVEFADFKCPHCKAASSVFDLFLSTHPDINFIFKPYPLDGSCNSGLPQKGDGSRCSMAAFALCAEKLDHKGFEMHHWLFDHQETLFAVTDMKSKLPDISKDLGLDAGQLAECADSAETYTEINKSAAEGNAANVEGTPTIYLNGKKLPWGQILEVLIEASNQ